MDYIITYLFYRLVCFLWNKSEWLVEKFGYLTSQYLITYSYYEDGVFGIDFGYLSKPALCGKDGREFEELITHLLDGWDRTWGGIVYCDRLPRLELI